MIEEGHDSDTAEPDAEEQARLEYEKARQQLRDLKGLVEHPGWKLIVESLAEQQLGRQNRVLQPATSIKTILEVEAMKNELLGIQLVLGLPASLIEMHEVAMEEFTRRLGDKK